MPVLNINLKKRLIKIHKPRRRSIAIEYIRARAAKLLNADPSLVRVEPELNRRAQLAARRMEDIKIEVEKEGEFIKAKLFKEKKEESKEQKEAKQSAQEKKENNAKKEKEPKAKEKKNGKSEA